MDNPLSICIIGDLMLDVVTHIPELSLGTSTDSKGFSSPRMITTNPGGTGFHLARTASESSFAHVSLISKIGLYAHTQEPDLSAQIILQELQRTSIQLLLAHDLQQPTGTTMITYLFADERILIYNRSANSSFTEADITPAMLQAVREADILFVSGYTLLYPLQAQAVQLLMRCAAEHHRLVVLDVVPHKIYEVIDTETFLRYTQSVHILVSELGALLGLFPHLKMLSSNLELAPITDFLLSSYRAVILHPSNEYQYVYDHLGLVCSGPTGYNEDGFSQGLSFLERRCLYILHTHYQRFTANLKACSIAACKMESNLLINS